MGVRGLQYYMDNHCPEACRQVNIQHLAEEFRQHRGTSPILVVDGMSCIRKLYGDLFWITGGQWREFVEIIRHFVSKFVGIGVRLVFFFDGATVAAKRSEWVERRLKNCQEIETIFEMVRRNGRQPDKQLFQLPASMGWLTRYILKHVCDCEVYTTIKECDEEVVEYARTHNCFALLGQDTDYIIYNTVPYLAINTLDLDNMNIIMYDRQLLAQRLGLHPLHLPLLACLRGNDVVPQQMLVRFHQWLCRGHRRGDERNIAVLLLKLADFIRQQPVYDLEVSLATIADVVFRDITKVELLRKGLRTYGALPQDHRPEPHIPTDRAYQLPDILQIAQHKCIHCDIGPSTYSVMCGGEFNSSAAMEDVCDRDLPSGALLFRPVRQRAYSVLFGLGDISFKKDIRVPEWCVYAGNPLKQPDMVEPIPLPGGTPSLRVLWLGDSNDLRWTTFLKIFGNTFNKDVILKVPPHLVTLCCTLNYFIQHVNMKLWEIHAFIAQAVSPITNNLVQLQRIEAGRLNPRAIQLAVLFMRGVSATVDTMGVCGNPMPQSQLMPWHFFDGKLFHHLYLKAEQGHSIDSLCNHSASSIEDFFLVKSVITVGTRLASD